MEILPPERHETATAFLERLAAEQMGSSRTGPIAFTIESDPARGCGCRGELRPVGFDGLRIDRKNSDGHWCHRICPVWDRFLARLDAAISRGEHLTGHEGASNNPSSVDSPSMVPTRSDRS